jgi:WD40 repeat protein
VQFAADGTQLTSVSFDQAGTYEEVSGDNTLRIWDVEQGTLLDTVTLDPEINGRFSTLSPDGNWLATIGSWNDPAAKVWNMRTGEVAAVLTDSDVNINTLAFSADGSLLLVGGNDGVLWVWSKE